MERCPEQDGDRRQVEGATRREFDDQAEGGMQIRREQAVEGQNGDGQQNAS
jgi:hypothetical protein